MEYQSELADIVRRKLEQKTGCAAAFSADLANTHVALIPPRVTGQPAIVLFGTHVINLFIASVDTSGATTKAEKIAAASSITRIVGQIKRFAPKLAEPFRDRGTALEIQADKKAARAAIAANPAYALSPFAAHFSISVTVRVHCKDTGETMEKEVSTSDAVSFALHDMMHALSVRAFHTEQVQNAMDLAEDEREPTEYHLTDNSETEETNVHVIYTTHAPDNATD